MTAWSGVIPVLVTPFDEQDALDLGSLSRLIEFNLAAGVDGLALGSGSELFKLTESERDSLVAVTVRSVGGSVPVIVQANADSTAAAARLASRAEELGADAILCSPPSGQWSDEELVGFYGGVARSVSLPVVLQDTLNTPVRPTLLGVLHERYPNIRCIKVETPPTVERVRVAAKYAPSGMSIVGGSGGNYFLEELRRGSRGTMPSCSIPDAFVRVWKLWQSGDHEAAADRFISQVLPLNRMVTGGLPQFYHVHKYVLWRRGLLQSPRVRPPSAPLDSITKGELDAVLRRLGLESDRVFESRETGKD